MTSRSHINRDMPYRQTPYRPAYNHSDDRIQPTYRMEGLNMDMLSGKMMRRSGRDPRTHSRLFLESYYRNSQSRSKQSAARFRKRTRDQRATNSSGRELIAATKKIRRLEVQLSYADKEIADLKNTLREYGLSEKVFLRPAPPKNRPIFVEGGIESDDYLKAIAASLETMEREIVQQSLKEEDVNTVGGNNGSVSTQAMLHEPEVVPDEPPTKDEGPSPPSNTTVPRGILGGSSLTTATSATEMMKELQEALQKWMIDFCEKKCYMVNSLENLVIISDTLLQYSAELQKIMEHMCKLHVAAARTELKKLHSEVTIEIEARHKDELASLSSTLHEKYLQELEDGIKEAVAKREARLRGVLEKLHAAETTVIKDRHEKEVLSLMLSLEGKHFRDLADIREAAGGLEGSINRNEEKLRENLAKLHAEEMAEIEAQHEKEMLSLRSSHEQKQEQLADESRDAISKREAELQSAFEVESEAKVTKALDAWKEMYQPLARNGALLADRKMAKALRPDQRDQHEETILRANEAVHAGSVLADVCRFKSNLPKDEISNNRKGFHSIYGAGPDFAEKLTGNDTLVRLLNLRGTVAQCKGQAYRGSDFAIRYEPLWKEIIQRFQGNLSDLDEFLGRETTVNTMNFLEQQCQEIQRQDREHAREEWKYASEAKKLGSSSPMILGSSSRGARDRRSGGFGNLLGISKSKSMGAVTAPPSSPALKSEIFNDEQGPEGSSQHGDWEEFNDAEEVGVATPTGRRRRPGRKSTRGNASGLRGGNFGQNPRGGLSGGGRVSSIAKAFEARSTNLASNTDKGTGKEKAPEEQMAPALKADPSDRAESFDALPFLDDKEFDEGEIRKSL